MNKLQLPKNLQPIIRNVEFNLNKKNSLEMRREN